MRKVVVTGLGAVTPVGNSIDETWASLCAGKSGIAKITGFDATGYSVQIAGEVKDFDETKWIDRKDVRKMARFTKFAAAASAMAMQDAGLSKEDMDGELGDRTGVILGVGIGGFEILESSMGKYFQVAPNRVPPLSIPMRLREPAENSPS